MSTTSEEDGDPPVLTLNVFMDKQKSKVLFAEADSHFVDALLTFLALPLEKVMDIVGASECNGPPNFFESLSSVSRSFWNDDAVMNLLSEGRGNSSYMLFSPTSSLVDELARTKLDISESSRTKYYICKNPSCAEFGVSVFKMENGRVCLGDAYACGCGKKLDRKECEDSGGGKLTRDDLYFIISDDLRVLPNVNGFRQTLHDLGIKDLDDMEMVTWGFDMLRITFLFELAMFSTTPLTDYAINCAGKKRDEMEDLDIHSKISFAANPDDLFHFPEKNPLSNRFLYMTLTVSLQKSTDKFLYALAKSDFIEFLLVLNAIPLGGVEFIFGGNTAFRSIDNLYTSVRDKIGIKYFAKPRIRDMLINPKLPYGYNFRDMSINPKLPYGYNFRKLEFLIESEQTPPPVYVRREEKSIYLSYDEKRGGALASFKMNNSNSCFVKANSMCIVSDDLSMQRYSVANTLRLLKDMDIPLSDVKEMQFGIGFDEAMRILKASVVSDKVFTDAIVNPKLEKMKNGPKRQRT